MSESQEKEYSKTTKDYKQEKTHFCILLRALLPTFFCSFFFIVFVDRWLKNQIEEKLLICCLAYIGFLAIAFIGLSYLWSEYHHRLLDDYLKQEKKLKQLEQENRNLNQNVRDLLVKTK